MRKLIPIIIVVFGVIWISRSYGYLLQSWSNLPPAASVSTLPVIFESSQPSDTELSYLNTHGTVDIKYFAKNVTGARSLALGEGGIVYVGSRKEGVVYALIDSDQDGVANERYVIASNLNSPNGVVYHEGDLYVAEIQRIIKFRSIDTTYSKRPVYEVVYAKLPSDGHHGWRYLALSPDKKLYLGIGAPCNICLVEDPYGTIARLNLDGTGFEIIARGIRNTVGFDWNPVDSSLWFTENGRDLLGDNLPADELNRVSAIGDHFGFPYCHEKLLPDPGFGKQSDCRKYREPSLLLSPHAAALGMKFVGNKIYFAEHGSWNRKDPIGYRLMSATVNGTEASNYQVVVDGWLDRSGDALGRPVDVLLYNERTLLISDDFAGAIYALSIK